ncbi:hypothetical protein [Actomonas aquatica]|uniref:Uncharacterized protein n=1 Tax=Actomonas aquatica TaxID=2866162 RepID=A0ABZ1C1T3_9BACT|nr:hypothetical protein [Opitutus sp. WL0086]WRQ85603.1 hypothetical protein K1X11_012395 [Opitutus sp. WL0086]
MSSDAANQDAGFADYKRAEKKALELLAQMKAVTPKKADIELALLVAIFELHRGDATQARLPAAAVQKIINGHLSVIVPHYAAKSGDGGGDASAAGTAGAN